MNAVDQHGHRRVQAFVEQAKAGGGFVSYYFDKPCHGVEPKLGYVELIPGTDILVGTAVYIDDIEAERDVLAAKISAQHQRFNITIGSIFIVILGVTLTLTLLISNRIAKSIRKTATQMHEASTQVASAARHVSSQATPWHRAPASRRRRSRKHFVAQRSSRNDAPQYEKCG